MTHIKDLHLNILQKVLVYFYDGFREVNEYLYDESNRIDSLYKFKQLLPPAAVCCVWRECMLPFIYNTAYLECHVKKTGECSETEQPKYEWKSNIDLVVSQRFSSTIRRLMIQPFECQLSCTDMAHALDTFGFSSSHWRSVNSLHINTDYTGGTVNNVAPSSDRDEALAAQLTEYFARCTPNIGDLWINVQSSSNTSRLLSNMLANLYIRQLHSLHCYPASITFSSHSFSPKLRSLGVGIAPGVTNQLPQLLASPLKELRLFDIPHTFAWSTFVGITHGHIEFSNLHVLSLQFRESRNNAEKPNSSNRQASMSTVSLNIGYRKLFFPKLKELHILDCPYSDSAFYSMFIHSPLQMVHIDCAFKSVQHIDPRILLNAADASFTVHSVSPDNCHDYIEFYGKLLGTPSVARVAWLGMHQSSVSLPMPSTIEWTNLERLDLAANIHLRSVIQVITQLPKLRTLEIENVVDEFNETGTNLQAILEGSLAQIPAIATKVNSLSIYFLPKRPLVFSLDVMRYLTILVHSLDDVFVPDLYVSDIKEFAAQNAYEFLHLQNIRVRGIPWGYSQ